MKFVLGANGKTHQHRSLHYLRYKYNKSYRTHHNSRANALAKATRAVRRHSRWSKVNTASRKSKRVKSILKRRNYGYKTVQKRMRFWK